MKDNENNDNEVVEKQKSNHDEPKAKYSQCCICGKKYNDGQDRIIYGCSYCGGKKKNAKEAKKET